MARRKPILCDEVVKDILQNSDDSDFDPDFNISLSDADSSSSSNPDELTCEKEDEQQAADSNLPTEEPLPGPSRRFPIRKKGDPESWKKNIRKRQKCAGESYVSSTGGIKQAKCLKPPPCKEKNHQCLKLVPEEVRVAIFTKFYSLPSCKEQWQYIIQHTRETEVQRRTVRCTTAKQKRNKTIKYFFTVNGMAVNVCKDFFLATIDSKSSTVRNIINRKDKEGIISEDQRGKHIPSNKLSNDVRISVEKHIHTFPVMDSHYCRKNTSKLYLDSNLSVSTMHKLYISECDKLSTEPVNFQYYNKIFKQFNLSFHVPKKDQCKRCNKYINLTQTEKEICQNEHNFHLKQKENARKERDSDKERSKTEDGQFVAFNFDLQAVLSTPKSSEGIIFYKRKLAVYNLTLYNLANSEVKCYLWDESQGKRGANEIATGIYEYISCLSNVIHCSIMSDSCGGQNRNSIFSTMCIKAIQNHRSMQILDHKFFETGHSHMECDSVHSKIEKKAKNVSIYTPNEWETIIKLSRNNPSKFLTQQFDFEDFFDFKYEVEKKIMCQVPWMKVCWLRYTKDKPKSVLYKTSFEQVNFIEISSDPKRGRPSNSIIPKAYTERIPISKEKYKDLLSLCDDLVIPKSCHYFYKDLPNNTEAKCILPEPNYDEESENE